jgi:hypothetical protein
VTAERTVDIQTTGDADAFLGLAPVNRADDRDTGADSSSTPTGGSQNEYVSTPGDGTILIDLDGNSEGASGLNQNAVTTFRNLVEITNNGTQTITSITLNFESGDVPSDISNVNNTFDFTVSTTESEGDDSDQVENGAGILTGSNNIPSSLTPGDSIEFGIVVDLINGGDGDNNLPDTTDGYTLTITANTDNTSTASAPSSS